MAERTDGYKIIKTTYGECRRQTEKVAVCLKKLTTDFEKGSLVGIYMQNSLEWIQVFWAVLKCGFKPVLFAGDPGRDESGEIVFGWADEMFLLSSGAAENVKLCAYRGENFFYQILDSVRIVKECVAVKSHYDGNMKL